jgi:DNA helicase-2/ATP-dependent DNA helicase PcrA
MAPAHVETETTMTGGPSLWRAALDQPDPFANTALRPGRGPGWDRAQGTAMRPALARPRPQSMVGGAARADIATGSRVFHQKFGMGTVTARDGNKLEVAFDAAGRKLLLDTFVEPA